MTVQTTGSIHSKYLKVDEENSEKHIHYTKLYISLEMWPPLLRHRPHYLDTQGKWCYVWQSISAMDITEATDI